MSRLMQGYGGKLFFSVIFLLQKGLCCRLFCVKCVIFYGFLQFFFDEIAFQAGKNLL